MSELKFNSLIPELSVTNLENSLNFYQKIIGFKLEYQRTEEKFAFISLADSQLMLEEINNHWSTGKLEQPFGRGINFQIEVKKIQPILDKLKQNNYPIFKEVMENWYRQDNKLLGNREFLAQDPDGYLLRFTEDLGEKPVNI